MRLSLCMIVRDEEATLPRCLESIGGAVDEIVIIDTGSTDDTCSVARRYTDAVYSHPWNDDFAEARNVSFAKATGDYLMWLDADDVIDAGMLPVFADLKARIEAELPDMVVCPYVNGSCTYRRERIIKRGAGVWKGRVHECIAMAGRLLSSPFTVTHRQSPKPRGARNLRIYQKWCAEEPLGGRDLFYYGRELYYNKLYTEAAAVLGEMLAGDGWYVNKIEACKVLAACREAKGDRAGAAEALLKSFTYGEPRGGVCCELARLFREAGDHRSAMVWYELACTRPDFSAEGDFDDPAARTLLPLLGMVCSAWALGRREDALGFHLRAAALAPDHPAVVHNAAFFRAQGMLPPA